MWNIDELLNKLDIDFTRLHDLLVYDPHAPMIFSSGIFLWLFAAFIVFYLLLQRRTTARLMFVTLFSYYFYYKSSGTYFFLLAIVTVSDFFIARLMERATVRWQRKTWVAVSLLINLGLLCYFKYTNFLCGFFASLTGGTFTAMDIFLPVGISFFTFQSLSYTIDVYRKEITPLTNLLDYAFYVSFFPQLVAGPIVRARDFIPQIRRPLFVSKEMFGKGIFLIVSGLFKKAVISDYISINFVERIFDNPTLYSGVENLMGVYGYALQIYCDFSGYSDMAIGIALLLGFHFNMNFDSPYKSASITEFWRRWHISLGGWFRDYLYIPLGGNRVKPIRHIFNILVVWAATGFWHGASWNFILWGLLYALLLLFEKYILHPKRRHAVVMHIYTMLFVVLGFVLFDSASIADAFVSFKSLFGLAGIPAANTASLYYLKSNLILLIIAALGATPLPKRIYEKIGGTAGGSRVLAVLTPTATVASIAVCTAYLIDGSFNPFVYFRF